MEEIKTLAQFEPATLFAAFNEAFSDYERSWSEAEFNTMLQRRGYNAQLSFGAFDKERLVSFTLNGTGLFNGLNTVYDTGTGTLNAYRAHGLATKIFEASLPHLKKAGFTHYLLEVLQSNTKAVSVYTKLGFEISREFNYFIQDAAEITFPLNTPGADYVLMETTLQADAMMPLWDFYPSWQNSTEAINRKPGDFKIIGAYNGKELIGYGSIEISSGDIPQLAVHKTQRRKGIATAILKELLRFNKNPMVKCINTDAGCLAMTEFFKARNITLRGKQFEMLKNLE